MAMATQAAETLQRASTVVLLTHDACTDHNISGHPEQPLRVPSIVNALTSAFPSTKNTLVVDNNPARVTDKALLRFHSSKHVESVSAACDAALTKAAALLNKKGSSRSHEEIAAHVKEVAKVSPECSLLKRLQQEATVSLDGDTTCMWGTGEAARRAAGAAVAAVDAVMTRKHASAFVAVRPPGHHAEPNLATGFCLFANAGVAALHARATYGITRVAVVDWDVHHGNGTQAFFEKDPNLFFASSHQMPCYPGTGHPRETGCNNNVVNVGLKPGSGSESFRKAWADTILPALQRFDPELVIVSAGFDAHGDDPLAEVQLEDEDFYWVQKEILAVCHRPGGACEGRLVSVLEGGYDLEAIARSAVECVRAQVEFASSSSSSSSAHGVEPKPGGGLVAAEGEERGVDEVADALSNMGLHDDAVVAGSNEHHDAPCPSSSSFQTS